VFQRQLDTEKHGNRTKGLAMQKSLRACGKNGKINLGGTLIIKIEGVFLGNLGDPLKSIL